MAPHGQVLTGWRAGKPEGNEFFFIALIFKLCSYGCVFSLGRGQRSYDISGRTQALVWKKAGQNSSLNSFNPYVLSALVWFVFCLFVDVQGVKIILPP